MNLSDTDKPRDQISLAIANFSIRLNCHHPQLSEVLRRRYQDFPPLQNTKFDADVHWVGKQRQNALLDVSPEFRDGILYFSASGYEGFIDEQNGRGELTISSTQPVEEIDYYLRTVLALMAHAANGVLLHTAGIIRNSRAYLFFGHSGIGKTTVCQVSQADHIILNDDLILLLPLNHRWQAYGTPFWNPTQVQPSAQNAPVAGLFWLIQAPQVFTRPLGAAPALAALIANVPVIPQDPERSIALLEILAQIQRSIPISELHFLPDNSFWNVIAP